MDAETAEKTYLDIYQKRLVMSVQKYIEVHGVPPPIDDLSKAFLQDENKPGCLRGYSEAQCAALNGDRYLRRVMTSYRDLLIHMAMVEGLKQGQILPYQLGSAGYLILGLPVPPNLTLDLSALYSAG